MKAQHYAQKKPMEFSKMLVIAETLTRWAVILFCCVMIAITKDVSPFTVLIPMTEAVCGITYGYYFWKAKAENIVRLKKENNIPFSENDLNGDEITND